MTALHLHGAVRVRLQDIGLCPGVQVACVHRGRGIAAYRIRGCVMALRDRESALVEITREDRR